MKKPMLGKAQKNLPGKAKKPQSPNFGKTPSSMKTPAMKMGGSAKNCYKKGGSVKGGGIN